MKYLLITILFLFALPAHAEVVLIGDYTPEQERQTKMISPFFGNRYEVEVVDGFICKSRGEEISKNSWGCTTLVGHEGNWEVKKIKMRKDTVDSMFLTHLLDELGHATFKTTNEDITNAFVYNFLMWFNWYLK